MDNTDTNTTRCPRTSAISPGPPMGPRDFPLVLLLLLPFLGVLSCSTGIAWFWFGFFSFLFCSFFDFLMHLFSFNKKACYLLSPLLSTPRSSGLLNNGLSRPPHHTCICLGCVFSMLPECHWGFSQKGKAAFQRQIASFTRQSPLLQAASKASHNYFMRSSL